MVLMDRVPLTALLTFCRAMRHGLAAGLSLVDVFRQQSVRGPLPVRPVAGRVRDRLEQGESLEDALQPERGRLPPLLFDLASVGENTGRLPEVFEELERYFELQLSLRRQFFSAIAWPAFELVGAFVVITLLMMILPLLTPGYDPLGFGTGMTGILRFWACIALFFGLLIAAYYVVTRVLGQAERVHRIVLRVPALGPTVEALALLRFCMAVHATWEAGLKVKPALRSSLRATGNPAFEAQASKIGPGVKRGDDVATILARCSVFPADFIDIVANAEEAGRLPEVMSQQTNVYRQEAERRLKILTRAAAWGVYLAIGMFIIFLIFRIMFGAMGPGSSYDETMKWVDKELPGLP
jgi:type II secretory pathway component PulF